MAIEVRGLEWLNHNANRAYPLLRSASATDTSGTFTIPNDFLVSMQLSVPTAVSQTPGNFHVMTINAYSAGYGVVIGYDGTAVASVLIPASTHTKNATYRFGGLGAYTDTVGYVTIGVLTSIAEQPAGSFTFSTLNGAIEADCIRPNIRNITSLRVDNGTEISDNIYGDVVLTAGTNMRIDVDDSVSPAVITFNAISGEGLTDECVCAGDADAIPIRTINGISPTAAGNFTILGNDCLQVTGVDGGIRLDDTCSEPCCGCTELEQVTAAAETVRQQVETIAQLASALESKTAALDAAVFASLLGDGGCSTC